jgi:pimeloyl-ACP methyl ester carboxylesterase
MLIRFWEGIGITRRNLFWLSDEQWARIKPHLPTDVRGVERVDDRRVVSGIVHVLKSGCRWCDCPPEYGPPRTIYNRFVRWARRGLRERKPPTLVVWGQNDPSFIAPGAEAYRRDLPDAEIHLLDAGHFALDEKNDEIASLILNFLSKHPL